MLSRYPNSCFGITHSSALDGQANLTLCFGVDFPSELEYSISTLFEAIIDRQPLPALDTLLLSSEGIDLIPSNIDLVAIEKSLDSIMSRERILKKILDNITVEYEYCLIDCAPSLGLLTVNALTAAHSVLIPTLPEFFAIKGLEEFFFSTIQSIRENTNPSLEIEGILINMYDARPTANRNANELIRSNYSAVAPVFKSTIPRATAVNEANHNAQSITQHWPRSKAAEMYKQFTHEFLSQEGSHEKRP